MSENKKTSFRMDFDFAQLKCTLYPLKLPIKFSLAPCPSPQLGSPHVVASKRLCLRLIARGGGGLLQNGLKIHPNCDSVQNNKSNQGYTFCPGHKREVTTNGTPLVTQGLCIWHTNKRVMGEEGGGEEGACHLSHFPVGPLAPFGPAGHG